MGRLLIVFAIINFLYGCVIPDNKEDLKKKHAGDENLNQHTDTEIIDDKSVAEIKKSDDFVRAMIEDTISYFKHKGTFLIHERDGFAPLTIKGFAIDGKKFVAAAALGQYLILYKYTDTVYTKIFYDDNAGMNPMEVRIKFMDINFDGYNDILFGDSQGAWGNEFSTTFLYDKTQQTYKRTPYLDLRNLTLDKKNKLLRTHSYRGAAWTLDKSIYRLVNDTIELVGEALYIPNSDGSDTSTTTKVFLYEKGIVKDSSIHKSDNAFDIYLKALWDNSNDYR